MPPTATMLTAAVETYLTGLRDIRISGAATQERSSYPALTNLLEEIGATLRPKVRCVLEPADQGAGHPDIGLYVARQLQRGRVRQGRLPERGVVEVKPARDDAWLAAESGQVRRYWTRYRLVLVTNTRDFVLVGDDGLGRPTTLETFRLAATLDEFETRIERPRSFARDVGVGLGEYLLRALSQSATLVEPGDLAWLLASYARDGLARVEAADNAPSLQVVQNALEEALGVRFEGNRGAEFFRSTLVQTLFYGIFSAWVLWARQTPRPTGGFNWHEAVWHLRVPVIQALYQQVSNPGQLQHLNLVEVLDWASAALDRVDRSAFFARFNEGEAVPYFYEPFLAAFDPKLRKRLGVWYTPTEVVRYMVARVDRALKDDLGIADGLAAPNVYVLDPCCGTGAYLAEVLRRIAETLEGRGVGALAGESVKQAAMTRIFGFEIMPAPLVVAHLQIGLTLQDLDAPLAEDGTERAGVFLTNALTGWDQTEHRPRQLPFPELDEERDHAERVKQEQPILVILGNPPYNGFAGVAVGEEERALSSVYRTTKRVRRPEGQGLNDLYVRFFRIAERRIVEQSGQGVVCYISNYSWLEGLSFTGMRERYLNVFDVIRIDNLHGDRIISEYAPDGRTSETIFALKGKSPGIKVGTSIALLTKRQDARSADQRVLYRDFDQAKAEERRQALLDSLGNSSIDSGYLPFEPDLRLGLPYKPLVVSNDWYDCPALPDLFPAYFPGVKTSRDAFLVGIDLVPLQERITNYFNSGLSDEHIAKAYPAAMRRISNVEGHAVRDDMLIRYESDDISFIRYAYRPYDDRWLYWESETRLLDRARPEYRAHVFETNRWLITQQKPRREWSPPQVTSYLGCLDLIDRSATCVPAWLHDDGLDVDGRGIRRPNLSTAARAYLRNLGMDVDDLFHYVLAVLHNPDYRVANAGGLRMGWPRIPLPGWPGGLGSGARDELALSAELGRELAALLDSDTQVPGVTEGLIHTELAAIAVPSRTGGGNMTGDDFALSAGWGHFGPGDAVMPGQGRPVERSYTAQERNPMGDATGALGDTTFDVYLNDHAYWRNVPSAVWNYKLGGYQVLKKWLSYREQRVLGRPLKHDEVAHFMNTARRIAALLLLTGDG